jgi:regulator of protease activity HflC (stomatin/prohibitin superfamily)
MDLDQFRKAIQAVTGPQHPSESEHEGHEIDTYSLYRPTTHRRRDVATAGTTMIVNYLSTIVFLALLGLGWLVLGRDLMGPQPPFLLAGIWFAGTWVISSAIKLAAQWERVLVFRLGRYSRTAGPGVFFVIPLLEQTRAIDTRVITVDIPRQEAITKDNVPVAIDGVVFLRVVRPDQAVINVQDYLFAIVQYARSALRDVIGGRSLDEVLSEREGIGHQIEQMLRKETEHWGMEVDGIRIQDIILPEDLKRVMSRQAGAEREKRAGQENPSNKENTMIVATIAMIAIAAPAQAWEITLPYKKGDQFNWKMTVNASTPEGEVEANLNYVYRVREVTENEVKGAVSFENLTVEGEAIGDPDPLELSLSLRGFAKASASEFGDSFRKMAAPIFFPYPESKVEIGSKWSVEHKGAEGGVFKYSCEAKNIEKLGDHDVLKVSVNLEEIGGDQMKSESTYWVAKDGRVHKMELRITNWIVPMAGSGLVNATITGILK